MSDSIFDIQAEFCKVMGNAKRLQVIHTLREGPMNVGQIAYTTGIPQPTISRQLNTLRNVALYKVKELEMRLFISWLMRTLSKSATWFEKY